MAAVDAFKVRAIIEAGYDKTSLQRANRDIERSFSKLSTKLAGVTAASSAVQTVALGTGAAFVAAFAGGVAAAAAFEEQFVNVKKTLDVKGEADQVAASFENISKRLRELVKTAPVTTEQINQIAAIGGQLGISANQLVAFTDTIQKLTVATNLSAEDAALSMARLQEITGSSAQELDNLGASLVALGNNFAAQESEIVTAALQIATSTAQISGEMNNAAVDALAFSTALKAIGQPSQAGATAVVRLMSELSEAVALGGTNLATFAKTAGLSVEQFTALFDIDSTKAVALFIKGLNDTSALGETNIAVLQKLGLGQVRTQKAILALAKANDTLFDAIDVANEGFVKNTALTEEAERRYATLFSEIQKGKNAIKDEIIDFGYSDDRLEKGTEAVRQTSNALLTITKFLRGVAEASFASITVFTGMFSMMKAIGAQTAVAAQEMQFFALYASQANAATALMNKNMVGSGAHKITSEVGEEAMGEYLRRGFYGGGIRGSIRDRITPSFLQAKSTRMMRRELLSNPALLQMNSLGGIAQDSPLLMGPSLYTGMSSNYLSELKLDSKEQAKRLGRLQRIGTMGAGTGIETRMGRRLTQLRLIQERKILDEQLPILQEQADKAQAQIRGRGSARRFGGTVGMPRLFDRGESEAAVAAVEKRTKALDKMKLAVKENEAAQKNLNKLIKEFGIRSGFNAKKIRNQFMADEGQKYGLTRGRFETQAGFLSRMEMNPQFIEDLDKSRQALADGNLEAGRLAMNVDNVQMNANKFRNAITGAVKAVAKLAFYALAMVTVFKIFEKMGERTRGLQQFNETMAETAEIMNELAVNTTKLANAERLLSEYSGDSVIEGIIGENIEDLQKQIEEQRIEAAQNLGKSFLEDIMIASFGRNNRPGEDQLTGTQIETLIRENVLISGESEEILKKRIGETIGNVIMGITDPESMRARGGQLPNINDLLEGILFREGEEGLQIPSGFFEGTSAQIFEEIQKESGALTALDIYDFLGLNPEEIQFNKFDEVYDMIINRPADYIRGAKPSDYLGGPLTDLFDLVSEFSDADPMQIVRFVQDYAMAISTLGGMTGEAFDVSQFETILSENSPLAKNIKTFLKERIKDFIAAGVATQEELNRAGDSYTLLYNLYSRAYAQFSKDIEDANKNISDELGITEEAALRVANKITEAFKESRKSLVDLFSKVPENELENANLIDILINNTKKARAQKEFEMLVRDITGRGQAALAVELTEMGILGGGLELARKYTQNPAFAAATELQLRQVGGKEYMEELMGADGIMEQEQMEMLGYPLGDDISQGLAKAFVDNKETIADALLTAMDYAVIEFKKKYEISSPSQVFVDLGEDIMGGLYIGIDNGRHELRSVFTNTMDEIFDLDLDGKFAGYTVDFDKFVKDLKQTGKFALPEGSTGDTSLRNMQSETMIATAVANFAGVGNMQTFLDELAKKIVANINTIVTRSQEAFGLITQITNLQRAQLTNELNIGREKLKYITFLENQAVLELKLERVQEQRLKAERDGIAGNITMEEKAGLLRQKIALDDRKRRLEGDFTASELLGIQDQERKVREYQRMFSLGVIGALELEAEQDRLRDMKGEFKSDDEKELFLLDTAIADERYQQAQRDAEAFDLNILNLREQERDLVFQISNAEDLRKEAYGQVEAAQESLVGTTIDLTAAYEEFKLKAPEYVDELGIIEEAFGKVNAPVGTLLDSINELGQIDGTALMTQLTPLLEAAASIQAAQELADSIYSSTATFQAENLRTSYMDRIKGVGLENRDMQDILTHQNYGLLTGTPLGNLISQATGNYEVGDPRGSDGLAAATQLFAMLEDVLGSDAVAYDQENKRYYFDVGSVSTAVGQQLMQFGYGGRTAEDIKGIHSANVKYQRDLKNRPVTEDPEAGDGMDDTSTAKKSSTPIRYNGDPRTLKPGYKYITNRGTMTKGRIEGLLAAGISVGPPNDYTAPEMTPREKALMGGAMMGMRTKGYKMGGRIPDMSHLSPRKFAYGGRMGDHLMKRALVGEYGPEEVRFVPGSGFLVKPLTDGGRGNNTIVENLSVNVTGVPSDPTSARKAAIEIRKALTRLDKEGTAGGGLTRR